MTPAEARELATLLNRASLPALEEWFDTHPTARGDEMVTLGGYTQNLYLFLMFHGAVGADHPLLQKVVARNPNPLRKDSRGQTALDIVRQRARVLNSPAFSTKLALAETLERQDPTSRARPLAELEKTSKSGLGLGRDPEGVIGEMLTGVKGSVKDQLATLKRAASTRQGGRKKRKTRRRTARSTRGRSR